MNAVATEEVFLQATLRAAIIYDDFEVAAYAAVLLERAALRADEAIRCDVQPWRLEALQQRACAAEAVAETANADVIILALNRQPKSMEPFLDWLGEWAARRQVEDAAVLLFCMSDQVAGPLGTELERFARWRGLTFLGGYNVHDDRTPDLIHHQWQPQLTSTGVPPFTSNPQAPSHWGINE